MKLKLIKATKKPIAIKDFYKKRNKILIKRECGGTGDILMQRMMFEDVVTKYPQVEINYAIPKAFHAVASNHPFVSPIDINSYKEEDFGICFNTTTQCRIHEMKFGEKNQKHRSDIWAESFGVKLKNHNMHLKACPIKTEKFKNHFKKNNKKVVLLATTSTPGFFGASKSLTHEQIFDLVSELKNRDYHVCTVHNEFQKVFQTADVEQFVDLEFEDWAALINSCDCVISIDTSTFHLTGGLKKPLVGIFSFTDGKVYGKYFDFVLVQKHRDNGNWDCGPCFNLHMCGKCKNQYPKPCMTDLSAKQIMEGFELAKKKWNF